MADIKDPKFRYPMSLYRGTNEEEAIVRNEDEEKAARSDGFLRWNENREEVSGRQARRAPKQSAA